MFGETQGGGQQAVWASRRNPVLPACNPAVRRQKGRLTEQQVSGRRKEQAKIAGASLFGGGEQSRRDGDPVTWSLTGV